MSTQTPANGVLDHPVVSHEKWLETRVDFIKREKEFTRLRDELSAERRNLPWERVDKNYVFEGPDGSRSLAQLFGDSNQLVVYHFMFAPEWEAGCKSCSFWADNFNLIVPHLRARDTSFMAISRAPVEKLEAYKRRMGWSFPWFSSGGNDFNFDYQVSFSPEQIGNNRTSYNYRPIELDDDDTDLPGISVFYKAEDGTIYHTYSAFARGIDLMNGAYNYMDLTPKGRDEGEGVRPWLRRRDEYDR
jgi:predicted dithiol-disulfide oxidoreductase (DUF899 family)